MRRPRMAGGLRDQKDQHRRHQDGQHRAFGHAAQPATTLPGGQRQLATIPRRSMRCPRLRVLVSHASRRR
jgi:hypothetical protein